MYFRERREPYNGALDAVVSGLEERLMLLSTWISGFTQLTKGQGIFAREQLSKQGCYGPGINVSLVNSYQKKQ